MAQISCSADLDEAAKEMLEANIEERAKLEDEIEEMKKKSVSLADDAVYRLLRNICILRNQPTSSVTRMIRRISRISGYAQFRCTLGWITLILFSILFIGSSIMYSKDMSYNEYINLNFF